MPPSRDSRSSTRVASDRDMSSESKYDDARSMKDDAKQQYAELRAGAKQRGAQLKEQLQDTWERTKQRAADAVGDAEEETDSRLYSLRSRVVGVESKAKDKGADLLEDEVQPRLRKAERKIAQATRSLRSSAHGVDAEEEEEEEDIDEEDVDEEEDDDDEEDEDLEQEDGVEQDEDNASDWKRSLKLQGTSLLNKAADVGSSIRTRLRNAAPELESNIKRGVAKIKGRMQDWNEDDEQMPAEEEEEEEDAEGGEEEEEEDNEQGDDSQDIGRTLRTGAKRAKEQLGDAVPTARRALGRARGKIDEAVSGARSSLNQSLRSTSELIRDTKSNLKGKAREQGFDWDQGVDQAKGKMRSIKQRGQELGLKLRSKVEELVDQASSPDVSGSDEDLEVDDEVQLSPTPSEDEGVSLSPTDSEDFQVRLEPMKAGGKRRSRSEGLSTPAVVIGSLFILWALASVYQYFGHPIEPTPVSLFDSARKFGHDMTGKAEQRWDTLKDKTQQLADLVSGRRPEPTLGDRIGAWGTSWKESIFGKPVHHYDAHDVKESVLHTIQRLEDGTYRMVDKLGNEILPEVKYRGGQLKDSIEHATEYTKDKLIPGAKANLDRAQESIEYHRKHSDEYIRTAKDSVDRVADMAREKAEDVGLVQKRTMGQRLWSWLSGEETTVEKAQRLAGEGYDRVKGVASDLKDRVSGSTTRDIDLDSIKARVQDGVQDLKDTVSPHHTLGERIKDGLDSIRSHLPGYQPTAPELARDYIERAKAGVQDLRDRAPDASELRARASELANEARDRVDAGIEDVKAQIPHRSLGDRLKDSLNSIKSHLPGGHPTVSDRVGDLQGRVQDGANELKHRVQDGIHGVQDGLHRAKDSVNELPHRARKYGDNLAGATWQGPGADLQHETLRGTMPHPIPAGVDSGVGHLDHVQGEAVPLKEVLEDISHATPTVGEIHHESLRERVRHAVHDGVEAIKSHLPGMPHRAATVPDTVQDARLKAEELKGDTIRGLHRAGETVDANLRHATDRVQGGVRDAVGRVQDGLHDVSQRARDAASNLRHSGESILDRARTEAESQLHGAKKGVEYAGHRVVHGVEKVGHRVEETYDKTAHRIEENVDLAKDKLRYNMP